MCRSFVSNYEENGKPKYTGRFNLGVTCASLPYAALLAKGDKDKFFEELDTLCELCYDANMFRVERFKKTKAKQNPILWMEGALARLEAEDSVEPLIYNGNATLSLGYIGCYEAQEICGDKSREFGLEIIKFLKEKTKEFTERCNIAWSPYGIPGESGAYRLMTLLKKSFPDYQNEREYLTNSFHLGVWEPVDVIGKFEYEADFYMLTNGGNVNNIELPNMLKNLKGFEQVVKAAYDKVQYLIVNQPVDRCFVCGFEGEFKATEEGCSCPVCGNNDPRKASCIARVSGYIHDKLARPANKGKAQEQRQRVKHL